MRLFSLPARLTGMRPKILSVVMLATIVGVTACAPRETTEERHHEANTAAGKMGQAAHKVAMEADKAGRVVGQHLEKAAHDAHEGWKEAAKNDKRK